MRPDGLVARALFWAQGLFVTYEYHSPFSSSKGATPHWDANERTLTWIEVAPKQFCRGRAKREKYEEKSFSSINLSAALRELQASLQVEGSGSGQRRRGGGHYYSMSSRRRWCDVCRGEADGEGGSGRSSVKTRHDLVQPPCLWCLCSLSVVLSTPPRCGARPQYTADTPAQGSWAGPKGQRQEGQDSAGRGAGAKERCYHSTNSSSSSSSSSSLLLLSSPPVPAAPPVVDGAGAAAAGFTFAGMLS